VPDAQIAAAIEGGLRCCQTAPVGITPCSSQSRAKSLLFTGHHGERGATFDTS
jgi:hypothetical protein